jgi:hypothetical protein
MESNLTKKLLLICGDANKTYGYFDSEFIIKLTEKQRIQVEAELIKHFEFDKIVWMDLPAGLTEDGERPIVAKSIKLSDSGNPTYKHKIGYFYTISFTPKMYEPGEMYKPVKDGCVITPVIYNPISFLPKRSVTIEWSPEFPQDIDNPVTWEDEKKMLHDKLETILENPDLFLPEGYRACLVRFAAV